MNRLQPVGDFMIIEPYKDVAEGLILPEAVKGELFKVIDIGPGYVTNLGKRIRSEVRIGDIVAIVGNILTIPFQGERYQIARSGDVIAYYRGELPEDLDIPEKI